MAMSDQAPRTNAPDDGLKRVLTWTLVALVAALLLSALGVYLVTRWFGQG